MTEPHLRYNAFLIFLHWLMALAFIGMLACGFIMTSDSLGLERADKIALFGLHKSIGVVLLVAFFIRLATRLFTKAPDFPATFKAVEVKAAKAVHALLYLIMLAFPMSGWVIVSSSSKGYPTSVFGLFDWPHIPGLAGNESLHKLAENAHSVFAWALIGLIVIHVAAVIKHKVTTGDSALKRMWW